MVHLWLGKVQQRTAQPTHGYSKQHVVSMLCLPSGADGDKQYMMDVLANTERGDVCVKMGDI